MSLRRILPIVILTLLAGAAPAEEAPPVPAVEAAKGDPAFERLFKEGVELMRQGRAHEALVVLEAARKRQPGVPEVPANMGFVHLAAKNYEAAQRNFEQALTVSSRQVNAYWGLAMAAHGQGDLELALGAMRTFEHLEKPDSPFSRKAAAAIWEWEEELIVKQGGKPLEIPEGAVGASDKKPVRTYDELRKDEGAESGGEKK